jgi:predicted nuclease with TOPRIM domain
MNNPENRDLNAEIRELTAKLNGVRQTVGALTVEKSNLQSTVTTLKQQVEDMAGTIRFEQQRYRDFERTVMESTEACKILLENISLSPSG